MYSDAIFNLLKRVTHGSFLFLCKALVFLFPPFLNLGTQIRFPKNWYTDLKSALDRSLMQSVIRKGSESNWNHYKEKTSYLIFILSLSNKHLFTGCKLYNRKYIIIVLLQIIINHFLVL